MHTIYGRNMHDVIPEAMESIINWGKPRGHMTESIGPVSMQVTQPLERLSYGTDYDLNPFAALATALWVIGGRNDVEFLHRFDAYKPGISDDDKVLHGAYGHRIRGHFHTVTDAGISGTIDQLKSTIQMLRPDSRPNVVVMSLWNACADMGLQSNNLPAATQLFFSFSHQQRLDMMVVYSYADIFDLRMDAISFSMLQQFIAHSLPVPIGHMTIVANCLGVETKALKIIKDLPKEIHPKNPYYKSMDLCHLPIIDSDEWLLELNMFLDEGPVMGIRDPFFRHVAAPMWQAWDVYKSTSGCDVTCIREALTIVSRIRATDWKEATTEWLLRKIDERT